MRIGWASDIHQLVNGRKLILGGVIIPAPFGELAHSDGDVVYHAIAEAVLGALGLGDLGDFFPDNDPRFLNIDSSLIVFDVMKMMDKKGYFVSNIDVSISLEEPKLKEYKTLIKQNVAKCLGISLDAVSIKAGTNEHLDAVGQGRAVKAECVVLLGEK